MLLNNLLENELHWFPESGIGYYPVVEQPYDKNYFDKYVSMADTEVGKKLNELRVGLVSRYGVKELIDIGIGSGAFIEDANKKNIDAKGFDINPVAIEWLKNKRLYSNPLAFKVEAMTFWDSLEHIHHPKELLDNVKKYVFVSCPIYEDCDHVLRSKHFRKDEHCWYWTVNGLLRFMSVYGFEVMRMNWMEQTVGREDIWSFVFVRKNNG